MKIRVFHFVSETVIDIKNSNVFKFSMLLAMNIGTLVKK